MTFNWRFLLIALGIGWAIAVFVTFTQMGNPVDALCYYGFDPKNIWDPNGCFLYSPPVAQVMGVIQTLMPFETFTFLLRAAETAVLAVVAGPALLLTLFIPAVAHELNAVKVFLLAPDLCRQYIEQLGREPDDSIFVIGWRLPLAALVVIWGARTNRRWTMI